MAERKNRFESSTPEAYSFGALHAALVGPGKHGKTTASLTISDDYPTKMPDTKKQEIVVLRDILHVGVDTNSLTGPKMLGIVPKYHIDCGGAKGPELMKLADDMDLIVSSHDKMVKKDLGPDTQLKIVFDSLTMFYLRVQRHWAEKVSGPRLWGKVLTYCTRVIDAMILFPCDSVIIAHTKKKVIIGEDSDDTKVMKIKHQKVGGLPGEFEYEVALSAQVRDYFLNNHDMIIPVVADGSGPNAKRRFHPNGNETLGVEGANRFQHILDSIMDADFHKVKAKIQASSKQQKLAASEHK